jgi:uridine kinase
MRVALLISGYLRTFQENFDNLKSQILNKYDVVDVYIHFTKNGDKSDKYLNFNQDVDFLNKLLNPKCLLCEDNLDLSSLPEVNNTLNLWFKYFKLNEIKKENEEVNGKYDIVIKWRPDLNIDFIELKNEKLIHIPIDSKIDKTKLKNNEDKFICDIFAYGDSDSMNEYFNIYSNLVRLIGKYKTPVSETLLFHYLNDFGIRYNLEDIKYSVILSKCNIFAIAGDSGSGKTTLGNLLKNYFENSFMLECDRYHKWERGDDNWQKITHLNPEANYLGKMNEDIFDLKVGKTIYQVNYDHKNGKFTEPERIESSDNIIVCGLHSLYNEDDNLYNIKIFIDTDTTLKYTWKIKRDIAKRGYSKEKILKQIEDRKEDYIKYIEPQKETSDVIVNFYTDCYFNLEKIYEEIDIKLNVFIIKSINIDLIINEFKNQRVNFTLSKHGNFNKISFEEYTEHNLRLNIKNFNFYDYIIFIILNLNNK